MRRIIAMLACGFAVACPLSADDDSPTEGELYLHGRVVAAWTGAPVADARVRLIEALGDNASIDSFASMTPFAEIVTDMDGYYRHRGKVPHGGLVSVLIDKPGYLEYLSNHFDRTPATGTRRHEDIVLAPGIPVSGTVTWPDGEPVRCGVVSVAGRGKGEYFYLDDKRLPDYASSPRLAFIDSRGKFQVHLPPTTRIFFFTVAGALPFSASVSVAERSGEEYRFTFEVLPADSDRPHGVEERPPGHAVETIDGASIDEDFEIRRPPTRRITVRFRDAKGHDIRRDWLELSTPLGRRSLHLAGDLYRSDALPLDACEGTVEIGGFEPTLLRWPPGAADQDLGAVVPGLGHYIVVAVNDHRGNPLEGASLMMCPATPELPTLQGVVTGPSGEATFGGLQRDSYTLHASHDACVLGSIPVNAAALAAGSRVAVVLQRGATLLVRIESEAGEPLVGANVEVFETKDDGSRRIWITDGYGRASLSQLTAGLPLKLLIVSPEHAPTIVSIDPLANDELRDAGIIELAPGATLRGVVRDQAGEPMAGAWVEIRSLAETGCHSSSTQHALDTAADGTFIFKGLGPGRHAICIMSATYHIDPMSEHERRESRLDEIIEVPAAGSMDYTATIRRFSARPRNP